MYSFDMSTITLTTKRQATFPRSLCDDLQVGPGDKLTLERRVIDGEVVWVVRRSHGPDWSWIGSAREQVVETSHDPKAIRASVARGRASERKP